MMLRIFSTLFLGFFSLNAWSCSPCGALSNVTQNLNGNNLELTFTSNAGWECCYTVQIEIVCQSAAFTGIANYQTQQICIGSGTASSTINNTPTPYPLTVIDVSNFCPGTYKWRAAETGCYIYTQEFTFSVSGNPMDVSLSATQETICLNDNTTLSTQTANGCSGQGMTYAWSPTQGLNNPNIANPVASPTSTTTYTCTVTELGTCGSQGAASITINVNPLPDAFVTGTIEVCQDDPEPDITFTGADATGPYTINYTLNGGAQSTIIANNSSSISAPTNVPGTFTYSIIDVTESSSVACSQSINSTATVIVYPPPTVEAGGDMEICEPNPTSPGEITLYGSGAVDYAWDNGVINGEAFVPPLGVTVYTVTGTDLNGCSNTDQVTITSYPQPTANGTADNLFGNVPIATIFGNLSLNADQYVWDFGDGTIVQTSSSLPVSHTYEQPGYYTVTLLASNGICYDEWTILIEVLPPMEVNVPNVFTPNGDGLNDYYIIDVNYGAEFYGEVFNRWGNQVTTLTHVDQGWDGRSAGVPVHEGVYYIKYRAVDHAGREIEGHTSFTLVR